MAEKPAPGGRGHATSCRPGAGVRFQARRGPAASRGGLALFGPFATPFRIAQEAREACRPAGRVVRSTPEIR